MGLYDIEVKTISGDSTSLKSFKGKPLLIVNVASECGLTPHYKGLQSLYEKYRDKGLEVLGFPCNQFGAQEPGDETEISAFCEKNYGVTFPMFAKIEVNGPTAHPIYKQLKSEKPSTDGGEDIEWNFAKFLVDQNGRVIERFHPKTAPEELEPQIAALL